MAQKRNNYACLPLQPWSLQPSLAFHSLIWWLLVHLMVAWRLARSL